MRANFYIQRLVQLIVVVFCVTFGCSLLLQAIPVSPAEILLPVGSPEEREALTKQIGLDRGPIGYYVKWLGEFVRGDFGDIYYSGGTEATALFPMVAETLIHTGFKINMLSEGKNPVYAITCSENDHPVICFSKTYDNAFNPESEFAAIMTCSNADVGCPFIPGAEKRIPITFDDPKAFDNTSLQKEKYHERSIQIATELCYVFSQIK